MTEQQIREILDSTGWKYWWDDMEELGMALIHISNYPHIEVQLGEKFDNGQTRYASFGLSNKLESPYLYINLIRVRDDIETMARLFRLMVEEYVNLLRLFEEVSND